MARSSPSATPTQPDRPAQILTLGPKSGRLGQIDAVDHHRGPLAQARRKGVFHLPGYDDQTGSRPMRTRLSPRKGRASAELTCSVCTSRGRRPRGRLNTTSRPNDAV